MKHRTIRAWETTALEACRAGTPILAFGQEAITLRQENGHIYTDHDGRRIPDDTTVLVPEDKGGPLLEQPALRALDKTGTTFHSTADTWNDTVANMSVRNWGNVARNLAANCRHDGHATEHARATVRDLLHAGYMPAEDELLQAGTQVLATLRGDAPDHLPDVIAKCAIIHAYETTK